MQLHLEITRIEYRCNALRCARMRTPPYCYAGRDNAPEHMRRANDARAAVNDAKFLHYKNNRYANQESNLRDFYLFYVIKVHI
ncbi:hypothetical protein EVAR_92437_1 [Eumeta japonica]|uniref:Uncharacterized protein n=1 Tax=Eumeta variegata TaxID=151549 RepID=A0A4C1T6S1_EUMVA|nr:hypothetical protein EVAR_92437_1 [Eumeta japonica]